MNNKKFINAVYDSDWQCVITYSGKELNNKNIVNFDELSKECHDGYDVILMKFYDDESKTIKYKYVR